MVPMYIGGMVPVHNRKALFLIDALISAVFAILLISALYSFFMVYKVVSFDKHISASTNLLLISSTKPIMVSNDAHIGSDKGLVCVLRVYHGVRRVCREAV